MLTGSQIRSARAALRLSAEELAHRACISPTTLRRIEAADGLPDTSAKKMAAVERVLWAAGAVFLDRRDPDDQSVVMRGVFVKSTE